MLLALPFSVFTPSPLQDLCGTCGLLKDVGQGVVDSNLKVHGVGNLHSIYASIFPVIPDCRIQNNVYMVMEKGADMIKAEYSGKHDEGLTIAHAVHCILS